MNNGQRASAKTTGTASREHRGAPFFVVEPVEAFALAAFLLGVGLLFLKGC